MNVWHRRLRKLIHRPFLAIGFRLVRAPRFERILRAWELEHDDFYFIQVGAHNGVTSDPFHRFLIEGWWWNVVLIEPQAKNCQVLREIYSDRTNLQVLEIAIGEENGSLRLYKIHDDAQGIPYWASQLASTRRDVIASHRDRIEDIEKWIVEVNVPCRTLASVYQEAKFPRLDLLAIDVEGFDFEVVKQIDGLPSLPKMIYFEHGHLSQADHQAALAFLKERGYRCEEPEQGNTFAWR